MENNNNFLITPRMWTCRIENNYSTITDEQMKRQNICLLVYQVNKMKSFEIKNKKTLKKIINFSIEYKINCIGFNCGQF